MLRARVLGCALHLSNERGPNKSHKAIAFADDIMILTGGETVVEAENYMNLEVRKILEWAIKKLNFNENKSNVMLMSRGGKREKKEIEIHCENKILKHVNI